MHSFMCASLVIGSAWAVPRRSLGEIYASPHGPHIEPTGLPECDMITGPEAPTGTENMVDAFSGIGTCQHMLDTGRFTCEDDLCPHCEHNQYCDGLCGFCTHDDAELPEPWASGTPDQTGNCTDDEVARAQAGISQTCPEVAELGLCEELKPMGMMDFCCEACTLALEAHPEFSCDENEVVEACNDSEAAAALGQGNGADGDHLAAVAAVCNSPCAVAISNNYDACMAMSDSIMFENRNMYALIIGECRQLNGGGH